MTFHALGREAFTQVRAFCHELIELRQDRVSTIGRKKGIYPSDELLRGALERVFFGTDKRIQHARVLPAVQAGNGRF